MKVSFEEALNFLNSSLQIYRDLSDDISFYNENQRVLKNANIIPVTERLGKTVERYGNAIFFYNTVIEAANLANPSGEQKSKRRYVTLSDARLYFFDLEQFTENIPALAIIKIALEQINDYAADKLIEWLSGILGINYAFIAAVKTCFSELLRQQNQQS